MHRAAQKYYSPYLLLQVTSGKIFLDVCMWMLTSMKQGTAACCARLKNLNGKAFPLISVVSNNELRKWDAEGNKRFQQTRASPGHKRPGSPQRWLHASPFVPSRSQAAEMLLAAKEDVSEGDSHFPLPSLYSHTTVRDGKGQPRFSSCACFSARGKKDST